MDRKNDQTLNKINFNIKYADDKSYLNDNNSGRMRLSEALTVRRLQLCYIYFILYNSVYNIC